MDASLALSILAFVFSITAVCISTNRRHFNKEDREEIIRIAGKALSCASNGDVSVYSNSGDIVLWDLRRLIKNKDIESTVNYQTCKKIETLLKHLNLEFKTENNVIVKKPKRGGQT